MSLNPQDYRKTEFIHRIGLDSARPNAADVLVGTLYFASDTGVVTRSNGISWDVYGGSGGFVAPSGGQSFILNNDAEDGQDGIPGIQGIQGLTGIQGIQGLIGNPGFSNDGEDGSPGIPGIQGLRGLQGIQGPSGIDGEDGIQGPQGIQGPSGVPSYQVGTWTPVLKFGGLTTGITYVVADGEYVKIGALVFARMRIALSSKGSATGNASVTGLPFTSDGNTSQLGAVNCTYFGGFIGLTGMVVIGYIFPNTTEIVIGMGSADSINPINHTFFQNYADFEIYLTYRTASVTTPYSSPLAPAEYTITSTGTQNDLNFSNAGVLRCNNASLLTINGLAPGEPGQRLTIISVGAGQVNLAHQNASSTASNRIINFVTGGPTPLAAGTGTAILQYDSVALRWKLVNHEQGNWIANPYSAGDYTANGSMIWTVDAGDLTTYRYRINGKSLSVELAILSSSISGTPSTILFAKLPSTYAPVSYFRMVGYSSDGGTYQSTAVEIPPTSTNIYIYSTIQGSNNWNLATNTLHVLGISFTTEII